MRELVLVGFALVLGFVMAGGAMASSLFGGGAGLSSGAALIDIRAPEGGVLTPRSSLFADRQGGSLFEPAMRAPLSEADDAAWAGSQRSGVRGLFDLIAKAEAGPAGYDALVWNARVKTPRPPSQMTLAEIYKWIDETPNQNHAIGRYQFIPPTLRRVVEIVGVPLETRFSPAVQDRLAMVLLEDAGLSKFENGAISKTRFMNNLAKIWAGLPNSTGRSHYHGFAGNKATVSWPTFKAVMATIFPG